MKELNRQKKYLDYLAAVIIGYSVMNHKDLLQCENKAQHLDTLAGLINFQSKKKTRYMVCLSPGS